MHVKSSIDYFASRLASKISAELGTTFEVMDLDTAADLQKEFASDNNAVLIELLSVVDDPRDPLYEISFTVGIKVSSSQEPYTLMKALSFIHDELPADGSIPVKDYSVAAAGFDPDAASQTGCIMPIEVSTGDQLSFPTGSSRVYHVKAKGQRLT